MPQLRALSAEEKVALAGELISEAVDEVIESDSELIDVVRGDYQHYLDHSEKVAPWAEVKERIRTHKKNGCGCLDAACGGSSPRNLQSS